MQRQCHRNLYYSIPNHEKNVFKPINSSATETGIFWKNQISIAVRSAHYTPVTRPAGAIVLVTLDKRPLVTWKLSKRKYIFMPQLETILAARFNGKA